jgi:plasmid stabilization system protein ParE
VILEYHRLAIAEARQIRLRLARESQRLSARFELAFTATVRRIMENPDCGSAFDERHRWLKVGRFRYLIYYRRFELDRILIFAIAHASRRPGYWLRRTRSLN